MPIRTVAHLKKFLDETTWSPERLSKEANISGMTIRRWLRCPSNTEIAAKHHANLDRVSGLETLLPPSFSIPGLDSGSSFQELLEQIEKDGKSYTDLKKLEDDTKVKFKDKNVGKELREQVKLVLKSAVSKKLPLKYKALAVGAILYFINPFDLIPDSIPVVGYLDDFAVLTLVSGIILKYYKTHPDDSPTAS